MQASDIVTPVKESGAVELAGSIGLSIFLGAALGHDKITSIARTFFDRDAFLFSMMGAIGVGVLGQVIAGKQVKKQDAQQIARLLAVMNVVALIMCHDRGWRFDDSIHLCTGTAGFWTGVLVLKNIQELK